MNVQYFFSIKSIEGEETSQKVKDCNGYHSCLKVIAELLFPVFFPVDNKKGPFSLAQCESKTAVRLRGVFRRISWLYQIPGNQRTDKFMTGDSTIGQANQSKTTVRIVHSPESTVLHHYILQTTLPFLLQP